MFMNFLDKVFAKKNFYFLIILFATIWFLWVNMDIAFMVFTSVIFACSLCPLVDKLSSVKGISRSLAATIVISALLLLLAIFIVPILTIGAYQITDFATNFPTYVDKLDNTPLGASIVKNLKLESYNIEAMVSQFASSTSAIIDTVIKVVENASSIFLYVFTAVILLFFFMVDKDLVMSNVLRVFPSDMRKQANKLLSNIGEKLGGYVVAQAVVSGSVWVTMTLGLWLFGIKYAFVLGLIAGVLSLIPVVGSAISLVICVIATYESGIIPMVIVAVMFTISHFIENHVVRPYVYSKLLAMHPILVFLALFIGAKYAGVLGVLLAPPMIMALLIIFEELYLKKMD